MDLESVDAFLRGAERLLLPAHCLLCGGGGDGNRDLCAGCFGDLPPNTRCCPTCALPLAAPAPACARCLRRAPPFASAFAPYVYAHPLDLLVTRLKYGHSLACGRLLSALWIDAVHERQPPLPRLFVPVPLHVGRLRERGYNQALELARPLAKALGVPLAPMLLQRLRATPAQAHLDARTRRRNLRDAFVLAPQADALPDHVAVIDDVMTTGATLHECARVLRRAGVSRVDVWALARAPRRG